VNKVWLSSIFLLLAINRNRGAQQEFPASIKVSKEIVQFQQTNELELFLK